MEDIEVKVRPDLIYVMSNPRKKRKMSTDHLIHVVKDFMNYVESRYPEETEIFTFLTNNLVQWKNHLEKDKIRTDSAQGELF